jgi:hypothetical protein
VQIAPLHVDSCVFLIFTKRLDLKKHLFRVIFHESERMFFTTCTKMVSPCTSGGDVEEEGGSR